MMLVLFWAVMLAVGALFLLGAYLASRDEDDPYER